MKKIRKHEEGMALLLTLMAIMAIVTAIMIITGRVQSTKVSTDAAVNNVAVDEACKAGIDIAVERLWHQYITGNGNTTGNLASYRFYADGDLGIENNEDLNGDGAENNGERDTNGNGVFDVAAPLVIYNPDNDNDDFQLGTHDTYVAGLTVSRTDDSTGSVFTIRSTGRAGLTKRTVMQTVRISGAPFSGYDYAVLAKNINCILCHAGFRALDQEYNTDTTKRGTFDRIKIATLESLLYRTTTADSKVAGTIYTRGDVYNESGYTITAAQIASSDFKGYDFNRTNGKVLQNSSTGAMTTVPLVDATVTNGKPSQFANLYKNYPTDSLLQTDGTLPKDFPAPYPDNDGDRHVDDDEYNQIADTLEGSLTGGIAYGVPKGSLYTGTALPTASNSASSALSGGRYTGNVILVGTDANPIQLNGNIAIDGDLVIRGKIKGWGQFFVRGNTYIVGDVTYADATNKFGVASDGTVNGMALISGGSVLMGDYLTIRGKNHTADTDKYPNSAYSVQCRTQNKSTNVTKNNVTQSLKYGYFDPGVVDAGKIETTMKDASGNTVTRTGQQFSFTTSELMLFNNLEVIKATEDPNYIPRFYGLRDSQPNMIYTYHKGRDEHGVRYDESGDGVKLLTDYLVQQGLPISIANRAAYQYMNPTGNWISEDTLRKIWYNDEMSRTTRNSTWKFDGLLYSNNAIFTITRSYSRHGSYTEGKMRIRGAVICPDIGVLTPGPDTAGTESLTLLYDRRVKRFWAPEDTTQVAFQRMVFMPEST